MGALVISNKQLPPAFRLQSRSRFDRT